MKKINAKCHVKNDGQNKLELGKVVVKVDPKYFRPTEVELLIGDASNDMKPQMSGGDENKNDKRKMFDNDYENFIKSRNEGIPVSTNRA